MDLEDLGANLLLSRMFVVTHTQRERRTDLRFPRKNTADPPTVRINDGKKGRRAVCTSQVAVPSTGEVTKVKQVSLCGSNKAAGSVSPGQSCWD